LESFDIMAAEIVNIEARVIHLQDPAMECNDHYYANFKDRTDSKIIQKIVVVRFFVVFGTEIYCPALILFLNTETG
jgi:hypothetical protein